MRVGRSVWELKIDPKRLREEIKNDIEKRRKKRDEQKEHQERQKELQKAVAVFGPATSKRRGEQFGRPRPLGSPHARGLINN